MNFFDTWHDLLRLAIVGTCTYFALVLLLRVYGKRTLTKMNAFDFVVTIALGSILAAVILSKDVSLAEGVLALVLLMSWQFVLTWLSSRFQPVRKLLASEPTLLFHQGEFLTRAMHSERVSKDEIHQAARMSGIDQLSGVRCVVLEPDGSLSVIPL